MTLFRYTAQVLPQDNPLLVLFGMWPSLWRFRATHMVLYQGSLEHHWRHPPWGIWPQVKGWTWVWSQNLGRHYAGECSSPSPPGVGWLGNVGRAWFQHHGRREDHLQAEWWRGGESVRWGSCFPVLHFEPTATSMPNSRGSLPPSQTELELDSPLPSLRAPVGDPILDSHSALC